MGLQIYHAILHDDNSNPLIPTKKFTLDALSPYDEMVVANQLEYMTITLLVMLKLLPSGTVDVQYNVQLNNSNDGGGDTAVGGFQLLLGTEKAHVIYDDDESNVNFKVSS